MSIRDIKRQGRRDLHEQMQIPALYLAPADPGPYADPVPCGVRLHLKFGLVGDLKGVRIHYAEREEITPKAIFKLSEVGLPVRNAVISLAGGEAYRVDHVQVPDDEFVTAAVVQLIGGDADGLPVPETV